MATQQFKEDDALRRLANRDIDAFAKVYDTYSRLAYSFAFRMLKDRSEAENVTQEIFLKLWRYPEIYTPSKAPFRTWLMKVTRNACIDRLRKKGREVQADSKQLEHWVGSSPKASHRLLNSERSAVLNEALTTIPEEQRKAIFLNFFDDFSHAEIADFLQIPLGTTKTRIRLGLRKLQEALRPYFKENE